MWHSLLLDVVRKHGYEAKDCAIYFRAKSADAKTLATAGAIKPMSSYVTSLLEDGFSVWESYNRERSMDSISASDLRVLDVEKQRAILEANVPEAEYVIDLVKRSRAANPQQELLSEIPLTMLDLALERLRAEPEKKLDTKTILGPDFAELLATHTASADRISLLSAKIGEALGKPGAAISGNLSVQTNRHDRNINP